MAGLRPGTLRLGTLRLGIRGGALAGAQAEWVAARLRAAGVVVSVRPVPADGPGAHAAVRAALFAGEIDAAVHSYKDLPIEADPRIVVAAVPQRADPRDALVARDGKVLGELPAGAVLGTSSLRRARQLRALGLGLRVVPVHGEVDSRISLVAAGECDGVVVAAAGLARLGRLDAASEVLDPLQMLPAPGQGALACECRVDDLDTEHLLGSVLEDAAVRAAVTAERALLAAVGGDTVIGALADVVEDLDDAGRDVLRLFLRGVAATADDELFRSSATAPYAAASSSVGPSLAGPHACGELTDAENLGRQVGAELLDLVGSALGDRPGAARPGPPEWETSR